MYERAVQLIAGHLPVVAAVQGAAIGGGLSLAMVGDFRVAAPASRFAADFARLGFHQGLGLSVTLPRAVGDQRALELLATGRRIDGARRWPSGCATGWRMTPGPAPTPWPQRSQGRRPWRCGRSGRPCGPGWSNGSPRPSTTNAPSR